MIIEASPPNENIIFEALILPQQWEDEGTRYFWYRQWESWWKSEQAAILDIQAIFGVALLEAKQMHLLKVANKLNEVTA